MAKKPATENIGPRTPAARKAVVLMNRIGHRPKSVIIQNDTEVVVQVRGNFESMVKKLKKIFKSKGKDESAGAFEQHSWKLRGMGLMNVYHREGNTFNSVRFYNVPDLGIKIKEEVVEADEAAKKATEQLATSKEVVPEPVQEDLDAILIDAG